MLETVHHLVLHVVFILFTVLLSQMFTREAEYDTKTFNVNLYVVNLVVLLSTMMFPLIYASGYVYDFKVIPIIIAFLYGGLGVGVATFASMLLIGLFTDHVFLHLIVNYTIYCLLLIPVAKLYRRCKWRNKLLLISLFYLFIPVTRGIFLLGKNEVAQLPFMIGSTMVIWVTLLLVIYLIENQLEQIRTKRELIKAEKFNVVSQLAASVAHEIRNPMTTVRGFMQLLQGESLSKEQKSFIQISIGELDRAQEVINQYLSLAKPQSGEFEVFSLTDTIHESVDVMAGYAVMNSIKIQTDVQKDLKIKGLSFEIKQVLINIVKNAIEAINENGEITVSATGNKDGSIIVRIKDNGPGISDQQLKMLGRPYYSTKEKGTGLGLTVSFEIIKRMKGEIRVESQLNEGTMFTIELPKHL
ncbi:sporulation kinase [Rossellomorea aquimaris]|uniref:ATP-binding protein n=1 Tax=Rossellomorea aquimaris TaxID=189382 RepID=UPI001CD2F8B9|nr:ATP-binding protein [Rossellomorea aquimaris]MCA1054059.1 sporulation kinase [Rossellomorea aquimaris]